MPLVAATIPSLIFLLAVFTGMLICKKSINSDFLLLGFICLTYNLLLNLPRNFSSLQLVESRWNWSGKLFALAFSFACIGIFRHKFPPSKVGLTATFVKGSFRPCLLITVAYLLIICTGSFFFQGKLPHSMTTDDILWNTTVIPDFSEELMERGLLLVLLNNIFGRHWRMAKAAIGPGFILICLLFGLEHGLFVNYRFHFSFDAFNFLRTFFVSAMAFTWLKERSGNLIFPTIAHFGTEMVLTVVIVNFMG